jgi:hypothetical protein
LPISNAATRWMISSVSCVSSSTPASLGSDDQWAVARRSRRAEGESDPRAQGNNEGPTGGSQHPAYQRPPTTKDIRRQRATTPIFTQERAPPAGRHRRLSGFCTGPRIHRISPATCTKMHRWRPLRTARFRWHVDQTWTSPPCRCRVRRHTNLKNLSEPNR